MNLPFKIWSYNIARTTHPGQIPIEWASWDGDLNAIPPLPEWATPRDYATNKSKYKFKIVKGKQKWVNNFHVSGF